MPEIEFISDEVLQKASLRGYSTTSDSDLVILVHKCEGRVFLTDRNGFYNDLLTDSWVKMRGNVILILTCNRNTLQKDQLTTLDI